MASADSCPITLHVAIQGAAKNSDRNIGQASPDKVRELSLHNRGIYPICWTRGFVMLC